MLVPRYEHKKHYPDDEFIGCWGEHDIWYHERENILCARFGDGQGQYRYESVRTIESQIDLMSDPDLYDWEKALSMGFEMLRCKQDPSISPNARPPSQITEERRTS